MNREDVKRMEEILEETYGPIKPYRPQKKGYVYFVQDAHGRVKIGWSNDPMRRLTSLQIAHSDRLKLLGVVRAKRTLERKLHERFAAHRISGEWFEPDAELLTTISELTEA